MRAATLCRGDEAMITVVHTLSCRWLLCKVKGVVMHQDRIYSRPRVTKYGKPGRRKTAGVSIAIIRYHADDVRKVSAEENRDSSL